MNRSSASASSTSPSTDSIEAEAEPAGIGAARPQPGQHAQHRDRLEHQAGELPLGDQRDEEQHRGGEPGAQQAGVERGETRAREDRRARTAREPQRRVPPLLHSGALSERSAGDSAAPRGRALSRVRQPGPPRAATWPIGREGNHGAAGPRWSVNFVLQRAGVGACAASGLLVERHLAADRREALHQPLDRRAGDRQRRERRGDRRALQRVGRAFGAERELRRAVGVERREAEVLQPEPRQPLRRPRRLPGSPRSKISAERSADLLAVLAWPCSIHSSAVHSGAPTAVRVCTTIGVGRRPGFGRRPSRRSSITRVTVGRSRPTTIAAPVWT